MALSGSRKLCSHFQRACPALGMLKASTGGTQLATVGTGQRCEYSAVRTLATPLHCLQVFCHQAFSGSTVVWPWERPESWAPPANVVFSVAASWHRLAHGPFRSKSAGRHSRREHRPQEDSKHPKSFRIPRCCLCWRACRSSGLCKSSQPLTDRLEKRSLAKAWRYCLHSRGSTSPFLTHRWVLACLDRGGVEGTLHISDWGPKRAARPFG